MKNGCLSSQFSKHYLLSSLFRFIPELTMTPRNALHYIKGTSAHASSFFFHTLLWYLQNTLLLLLFTSCFGIGSWISLWSNRVLTTSNRKYSKANGGFLIHLEVIQNKCWLLLDFLLHNDYFCQEPVLANRLRKKHN